MSTQRRVVLAAFGVVGATGALAFLLHRSLRARKSRAIGRLQDQLQKQIVADRITVVDDEAGWNEVEPEVRDHVEDHPVIGFDCEWVTRLRERPNKVALIQIALSDGRCILVRTCRFSVIPKSLVAILSDRRVLKLGVGIHDDDKKMRNDFGVSVRGFVDLRFLVPRFRKKLSKMGLAGLASAFLGVQMDKDWRIRAGDWEAEELTERQVLYAANDALVAVNIGFAMVREKMERESVLVWNRGDAYVIMLRDMCKPFRETTYKQRHKHVQDKSQAGQQSAKGAAEKKEPHKSSVRKTPLYNNAKLEAPDGQPLCVCDKKKAEWYVTKGLGTMVEEEPSFTVRLNFEPTGRPEGAAGEYYLTFKENVCVVCGATESYLRKYIVPHEYRKYFPVIMRDHQSHDVLLLCDECHRQSNLLDFELRKQLADECEAPIGIQDDVKVREDLALKEIRSAARALMKDRVEQKIPKQRTEELEAILRNYYNVAEVSEDIIEMGENLEARIFNSNYKPHGLKVVEHYKLHGGLLQLERRWREHFLKTMEPKFLPPLWSVDHQQERLDVKAAIRRINDEDIRMAHGLVA